MQVIGIGEKKTPNPFIVACDKFIYIEILKSRDTQKDNADDEGDDAKTNKKSSVDNITRHVIQLIKTSIEDLSDEDGWAFLGDVGSLIQKKRPNFDSRNYGFQKLTPLIKSIGEFEVEERIAPNNARYKHIYIKNIEKPKKGSNRKKQ